MLHRFRHFQLVRLVSMGNKRVDPVPRVVGYVIQWIPRDLENVPWSFLVVHPARDGLDEFWAVAGNLPFPFLQHLVHQLPAANSVVGCRYCAEIVRSQDFVDLVSNGVAVADVLEVGRVEIDGHNAASLPLFRLRRHKTPHDFLCKFIRRKVRSNELTDCLDLSILSPHMKVR